MWFVFREGSYCSRPCRVDERYAVLLGEILLEVSGVKKDQKEKSRT